MPSDIPMFVFEGGKPKRTTTGDLFGSKKVAIVGIPGAFTPTCSTKHLPSFVEKAEEIKSMGFDEIACVAVNDAFVLSKWGQELDPDGKIHMVADGTTEFSKKLGLDVDAAEAGMCGVRLKRSAMVLEHLKASPAWHGSMPPH